MTPQHHSEHDPLVRRALQRTNQANPILICLVVALVGWVVYRELLHTPREQSPTVPTATLPQLTEETPTPDSTLPVLMHAENRQRFAAGESTKFGISAVVKGKGTPALEGTTGLRVCFEADYALAVTSVLEDGSVTLEARFGDANVYGNQFGYPVNIARRNGVTQSFESADNPVRTALNENYDGPSLTDFDAPIIVNIAPDGTPTGESDTSKVAQLLGAQVRLSGTAFPQSELRQGMSWERDVVFTLPGMKFPVGARVTSTLVGPANYYGLPCVQIQNQIEPIDLAASGPIPALRAANEKVQVAVSGSGTTYYDPISKWMLFAQSEFDVNILVAASVEAVSELFGTHSDILGDLEGSSKVEMESYLSDAKDVPIGLNIQTSISRKQ